MRFGRTDLDFLCLNSLSLFPRMKRCCTGLAHLPDYCPRYRGRRYLPGLGPGDRRAGGRLPIPCPVLPGRPWMVTRCGLPIPLAPAISLPAYLRLAGEAPMGAATELALRAGECALIHTGGMLPDQADAVVMVEHTQSARTGEIEICHAVAVGENVIQLGRRCSRRRASDRAGRTPAPAGDRRADGVGDHPASVFIAGCASA